MTEILSVCAPKQPEPKEIPTAPVSKFSCYAFADHPPPTRESGQQNENIQDRSRGVKVLNGNNINKKKEKRGEEQKTKEAKQESKKQEALKTLKKPRITWEAKTVEINFVDTPCKEKQLLLEQLARALYDYSCQLAKAKVLSPEAPNTLELRRTGTNG
jgi:hypothetical protein